ncbi:MAG: hypothetical protein ACK4QW_08515 [Alphaproteobacteria bacterium]
MGAHVEEAAMGQRGLGEESQRKIAIEMFLDTWDKAADYGVTAEILAEVLIYLAVTDLVDDRGEEWAADIVSELPDRIRGGEFTLENEAD